MTRSNENPKNWLFKQFMKSIAIIEPDWVVIENVPGLRNMDKGFFLEEICDDLHRLYSKLQNFKRSRFWSTAKKDNIVRSGFYSCIHREKRKGNFLIMDENLKVHKEFKEAFNLGYELAKELKLKSPMFQEMDVGNVRMQAMQAGMVQYHKEISLHKNIEMDGSGNLKNKATKRDKGFEQSI